MRAYYGIWNYSIRKWVRANDKPVLFTSVEGARGYIALRLNADDNRVLFYEWLE